MRVLVIEDHAELVETVALGLQREGLAVDLLFDGAEGLRKAAVYDYDVIVLDRDLPGVHGDRVCETRVNQNPHPPRARVLMLTASAGIEDRVAGLSLGPRAEAVPANGEQASGTVSAPAGGQAAIVQLLPYSGRVTAVFKQLTTAQAAQLRAQQAQADARYEELRSSQLDTLLTRSGPALAIMALASIGLGWLIAGRALRPVRTMSSRARGISERNLHERLALEGPDDELKELGDTFDGLLGRLEAAFESQRRFVANASHELRTPITLERALVEVALSDPNPSVESVRETCRRMRAASEQQERLIEALLTLARSQRGLESPAPVDLREVTAEVVRAMPSHGVKISTELGEASTTGDPAMVERLVAKLIENAVRYNEPDGWVTAWTGLGDDEPTLEVANAGPVVEPEQVDEPVKPFSRVDGNGSVAARNADARQGLGLGLSIVQAIVDAHGARLTTTPRAEGGLRVAISFPRPD